ncbi:alternative ribosome rescue aminoacyl-tRNA hydrolase ArfB [Maribellus sp. YY47]|uniref:alternative ribosome rescue aminoacyl-tRNA hydrolase ArfB n=1 Tax=Maribellus sp. YY47 TaxID=2929486 RepID=UPI002001BEEE|nr:alternative ribosome rescue aminoacyl-tRNA hydrolase ArfB [Maribellus sp. YY47]MCK3683449.1 aminoacyl-tRNA hydrolase [Maribellus sp. YY47]
MQLSEEIKKLLEAECTFSASRSSGPGGQNVNKVNTRVELRFSVENSQLLSDKEKSILFNKLKNRINSEGELILASEAERSQLRNRVKVTVLFFELIEKALTPKKKRIRTSPTLSSRLKRLDIKKQMAEKKARRQPPKF